MKTYTVPTYLFVQQMQDHQSVKKVLLEEFEKVDSESRVSNHENITATDWMYRGGLRNWEVSFKEHLYQVLEELKQPMLADTVSIDSIWFQQYLFKDYHSWHTHSGTNYSSVYFVECPQNMQTEFFDPVNQQIIKDITVNEGDIITFPSQVYHRSKPNLTEERKTIVSWNSNFLSSDDNKIVNMLSNSDNPEYVQEGFNNGQSVQFD